MAHCDLSRALEMVPLPDPGRVRSTTEDAVLANARLGLAVLADGMGGHNAGEIASGMAVALIGNELEARLAAQARP
ncbi:MAG: protein phosphatase, partial [Rhodocyclaceae bacterium]|nr:protein phosphatase [Rhodocyclaceae bacterium]